MKKPFKKIKADCEYRSGKGYYCWSYKRKKGIMNCLEKNCPEMKKHTKDQPKGKKK